MLTRTDLYADCVLATPILMPVPCYKASSAAHAWSLIYAVRILLLQQRKDVSCQQRKPQKGMLGGKQKHKAASRYPAAGIESKQDPAVCVYGISMHQSGLPIVWPLASAAHLSALPDC